MKITFEKELHDIECARCYCPSCGRYIPDDKMDTSANRNYTPSTCARIVEDPQKRR